MNYGQFQAIHLSQCKALVSPNCGDSVIEVSDTSMLGESVARRSSKAEVTVADLKKEIEALKQ